LSTTNLVYQAAAHQLDLYAKAYK